MISVPRRIINPRCNSNWEQSDWGTNTMEEYVAPGTINYYRLHPNYFFQSGGFLRIQGRGFGPISVCSSRWVERPRQVMLHIPFTCPRTDLTNFTFVPRIDKAIQHNHKRMSIVDSWWPRTISTLNWQMLAQAGGSFRTVRHSSCP